jgi:hypothetical protein
VGKPGAQRGGTHGGGRRWQGSASSFRTLSSSATQLVALAGGDEAGGGDESSAGSKDLAKSSTLNTPRSSAAWSDDRRGESWWSSERPRVVAASAGSYGLPPRQPSLRHRVGRTGAGDGGNSTLMDAARKNSAAVAAQKNSALNRFRERWREILVCPQRARYRVLDARRAPPPGASTRTSAP